MLSLRAKQDIHKHVVFAPSPEESAVGTQDMVELPLVLGSKIQHE